MTHWCLHETTEGEAMNTERVLVPREPTAEMITAGLGPLPPLMDYWVNHEGHHAEQRPYAEHEAMVREAYAAMLAAAPALPAVDDALADTQRAIIEAAELRGYRRAQEEGK